MTDRDPVRLFSLERTTMMTSTKRRTTRRSAGAVVALALSLGFAGQASATTIGQTGGSNACAAGELQLDESPIYAVPGTNGVIDRFFFNADGVPSGQKVDFLVLHHLSGLDTFVVIGDSGTKTIAPGGGVQTFLPNTGPIPAQVGDVIGTYAVTSLSNCQRQADSRGERQGRPLRAPKVGDAVVPVITVGWDVNVAANFIQAAPGTTTLRLTDSASPTTVRRGWNTATYTLKASIRAWVRSRRPPVRSLTCCRWVSSSLVSCLRWVAR